MKHIYRWTYVFLLYHLLCVAPSFALDGCREHIIMTDAATLTATVSMDPYHRYRGELGTDLTHEVNPRIYFVCGGREQVFYGVPEGNYVYRNSDVRCRVSVVMDLKIVAVDDEVSVKLPCDSTPFTPYFYDILGNDYQITRNAERPARILDSITAIHLVEAPSFVSVVRGGLSVDMPSDGNEGTYEVKYYLRNNIGVTSDTAVASIRFYRHCPKKENLDPSSETFLDLPNFFSPNGDGVNDVWEIAFLDTVGAYKLDLYDRFGRLIRSYHNDYMPWDGTSGGRNLPSDDYWYYLFLFDLDRSFVGHVTLRR
ncbi:MAG: T9SS type B sorting domain-containing protein [Paludibacteraceae bacterium]|nr:T9SS type B sorting domain-containing protein [Paludibacteraceae bacterium]